MLIHLPHMPGIPLQEAYYQVFAKFQTKSTPSQTNFPPNPQTFSLIYHWLKLVFIIIPIFPSTFFLLNQKKITGHIISQVFFSSLIITSYIFTILSIKWFSSWQKQTKKEKNFFSSNYHNFEIYCLIERKISDFCSSLHGSKTNI